MTLMFGLFIEFTEFIPNTIFNYHISRATKQKKKKKQKL